MFPCVCQLTRRQADRQAELLRYSGLEAVSRFSFHALVPEGRGHALHDQRKFQQAVAAAQAFSENLKGWLVFTGPSGCGKTHLAAAIAHKVVESGRPAFFITLPDLLDRFRASFSPSSEIPYDSLFERVCNTPLLVLDDLGAHSGTAWAQEKLFQLLNHRYNTLLPTVITIGVPLRQLDERLRTRIADPAVSTVVEVAARQEHARFCIGRGEEALAPMTFASFDVNRPGADAQGRASLESAVRFCKEFAASPKLWLLLVGSTLSGKTHLLAAIYNERKEAGKPITYAWVPALLEELRSAFRPGSEIAYDELFDRVKEAPVLLLDDLGSEHTTPWAQEKLHQLLVHRYDTRLPTVVASQLTHSELEEKLSPALAKRLLDPHPYVGHLAIGVSEYHPPQRGQYRRPTRRDRP